MKKGKLVLLGCIAYAIIASTVYAGGTKDGFYGGLAVIHSGFFTEKGSNSNERKVSSTSVGVYGGYKHKIIANFFGAGEVFYHDTAQDKNFSNGDKINIESQYGVKSHWGYEGNWGSVYGIVGIANFDYDVTLNEDTDSHSGVKPIVGLGASYQINENFSTNIEFTGTGDSIDIAGDNDKVIALGVSRLSLTYHF